MVLAAILHRAERSHERLSVGVAGTLRDGEWTATDVFVDDLSRTGFLIRNGPALSTGEPISLGLPGMGVRTATVARITRGGYGCEFDVMLDAVEFEAVLSGPSVDLIPFPRARQGAAAPTDVMALPLLEPPHFSRRSRLIGLLGLTAASWGVIGLIVAALR